MYALLKKYVNLTKEDVKEDQDAIYPSDVAQGGPFNSLCCGLRRIYCGGLSLLLFPRHIKYKYDTQVVWKKLCILIVSCIKWAQLVRAWALISRCKLITLESDISTKIEAKNVWIGGNSTSHYTIQHIKVPKMFFVSCIFNVFAHMERNTYNKQYILHWSDSA